MSIHSSAKWTRQEKYWRHDGKSRTLLYKQIYLKNLRTFAVMTAGHLISRLPSKTIGMRSPIEILEEAFPMIKLQRGLNPREFG